MTVLAIINPHSLLGDEIKQELGRRKGLWSEIRLLATEPDQIGEVTEINGEAALVQECSEESLHSVEIAILLPGDKLEGWDRPGPAGGSHLLVVAPSSSWSQGVSAVAGLDSVSTEEQSSGVLISPSPVVILLAHLLRPLQHLAPSVAVAQVLMPASNQDQAGLDELFGQTRSILAMSDDRPTEIFGKQIAFNLLPVSSDHTHFLRQLEQILGKEPVVTLQIAQAGVFHSMACSLVVTFEKDPGIELVRKCLEAHPGIEMVDDEDRPGPTDAAAREEVLVSGLRPSPNRPGSYQLWAVMDNLTRGGASNVLEIIESLLAPTS